MKKGVSKFVMAAAAIVLCAGISIVAHGATTPASQTISLTAGKAETIGLPQDAADILVANPGIADVGSLRADRLYVVGRGVGDTNILAFDANGRQIADIAVQVGVDDDSLRKAIRELFPKERIEVRTINNNVVLKGSVSTPVMANQVRDLATRFIGQGATNRTLVDLMRVRGEQQVMLKVKVLEVQRNILREMGVNLEVDNILGGATNQITGSGSTTPGFGISATQFGSGVLSMLQRGNFGPLTVELEGLETAGLLSTLAEPTLTAVSGESAGFLAGGEFPIPASRDQNGNVTLEFRQFGVSLSFIPTVMSEENISLQLTSEVSERSDADGVTLQGTLIPGLSVRRAQTTVQMASGGTIMIAGLLRSRATQGLNGLPGFKDMPILGELFKSRSFQRGESELVFLVTPYLVEPFADQQAERVTRADNDLLHSILQTGKPLDATTSPATLPGKRGLNDLQMRETPAQKPQPHRPEKTWFRKQGDESRTAGEKKADADVWRKKDARRPKAETQLAQNEQILEGAPVVSVDQAPVMPPDHPALNLPVGKDKKDKKDKAVSLAELGIAEDLPAPLPRRSPAMRQNKLAAVEVKSEPVALKAEALAKIEPAAGAVDAADKVFSAPKADKPKAKTSQLTIPLPRRKPVVGPDAASAALSSTFMNSLKKIYGNRVSAKLGEGKSYGYIVE